MGELLRGRCGMGIGILLVIVLVVTLASAR